MPSKKKGRPRKNPKPSSSPHRGNFEPPILVPKTDEMKIEEAKEAVMEKMLDPKNITPDTMPSFAPLESYIETMSPGDPSDGKSTGDDPVSDEPSEDEIEDDGGVIEITPDEDYVEIAPKSPKPRASGNFENLKAYNKLKSEKDELAKRLSAAESELNSIRKELESESKNGLAWKERAEKAERDLERELATERSRLAGSVPKPEYDRVVEENDELLLKNSELELENSILKESSKKAACERETRPFTYTKPGYEKPKVPMKNTRPSMNGYEDWV